MAEPRELVRTAVRMYDMQEQAQRIFGAEYAAKTAPWIQIIMSVQQRHSCDVIQALLHMAQAAERNATPLSDIDVLLMTAAAVEMSETDRILETLPDTEGQIRG